MGIFVTRDTSPSICHSKDKTTSGPVALLMTNVDATDAPPINNDDGKNNSNARLCNGKPMYHKMMHGLFLCIVMSCTIGLICIASLVQYGNLQLPRLAVPSWHSNNATNGNGTLGIQTKKLVRMQQRTRTSG